MTRARPLTAKALAAHIHQLAIEQGPATRLPTMKELCARFHTTMATLQSALSLLEEQRVIVSRRGSGIFVAPHIAQKGIGVLIGAQLFQHVMPSPFWGMLWGLLVEESERRFSRLKQRLYFQVLQPDSEQDHDFRKLVRAGLIHGIIGIGIHRPDFDWLFQEDLPFVSFASDGIRFVCLDHRPIWQIGVPALVKDGCRSIQTWISADPVSGLPFNALVPLNTKWRAVFEHLCRQHQLPYEPDRFRQVDFSLGRTQQEQGYRLTMSTFGDRTQTPPDGLIIIDDMMTQGVLRALYELGLRVGHDVKIVTHANIGSPLLFEHEKDLVLIAFDPKEIVQTLFEVLEGWMEHGIPEQEIVFIPPHLRQSNDL